jgi:hypothetical protein
MRRWRLAGLVLAVVVCTAGCNPLTLPFFLMWGVDSKYDPECKLAVKEDKDEAKVVILTYSTLDWRPELLGADRELSNLLARKLTEACKANKEKVTVVSPLKVQRYKDAHPNWHAQGAQEIGKHFEADYVIDLELQSLGIYEPRSMNSLFRGETEISVAVLDVENEDEEPIFRKEYRRVYPKSSPVAVSESSPQKFRMEFLAKVATDLAWVFTAHSTSDHYMCD